MVESVPNTFPSLFWGYAAIWAIVVLYVVVLGRKLAKLESASKTKQEE